MLAYREREDMQHSEAKIHEEFILYLIAKYLSHKHVGVFLRRVDK